MTSGDPSQHPTAEVPAVPPPPMRAGGGRPPRPRVSPLGVAVLVVAVLLVLTSVGLVVATLRHHGGGAPTTTATTVTTATRPPTTRPAAATTLPDGAEPAAVAAVTTGGALELMDPANGSVVRTLVPSGVAGGEVATSPDGTTVYFEVGGSCDGQLESVPARGGTPVPLGTGSLPAVSPDGAWLAYMRQPDLTLPGCAGTGNVATAFTLVLRHLTGGTVRSYPVAPSVGANGLPQPVSYLSWAPDSRHLAVSIQSPEDNEGWQLLVLDTATARYYAGPGIPAVPLSPAAATGSYYRQGAFTPSGSLFVSTQCCLGLPGTVTAVDMQVVSAATGRVQQQVAVGYPGRDHTSLSAAPGGHWLLYLSGDVLYVSHDGATPVQAATGLSAAAW